MKASSPYTARAILGNVAAIFVLFGVFSCAHLSKRKADDGRSQRSAHICPANQVCFEEVVFSLSDQSAAPDSFAKFPGGKNGLLSFYRENINISDTSVHGRILVQYIIDAEGNVQSVTVLKGISPSLDAEIVRVVKDMPKWKPAYRNGIPVSIEYQQPFRF